MLSYQHIFHAGSAADVFKHTVLALIIKHLNKKDKPYTVIDTHAGRGLYDLKDPRALKTLEAEEGIKRLLKYLEKEEATEAVKTYIETVIKYFHCPSQYKSFYPGSSALFYALMRRIDNLVLCELHPEEIKELRRNMALCKSLPYIHCKSDCPTVAIHFRNGYEGSASLTPPKTRRGLLFIDPSYEDRIEYDTVSTVLLSILHKWKEGIIALWYPVLEKRDIERKRMIASFAGALPKDKTLNILFKAEHEGLEMKESGMLIINPPYLLSNEVKDAKAFLEKALG